MPNRVFSFLLFAFSISACARSATRAEPEPSPAIPSISLSTSSRTSWTITPSNQAHHYRSITKAIVEQNDPSLVLRDSLTTTTDFTLSLSRDSRSLSYNATIRAFSIQGSPRSGPSAITEKFPLSLSGRLEGNRFLVEGSAECSSQGSAIMPAVQRLVVPLPTQLRKDQTWTDSISSNVCSGSIPVVLTTVRTYRVVGEAEVGGAQAIRLSREDRTASQGEGSEDQHRIQIQTEGSGQGELLIDRTTGSLIESSTTNAVTLTITTSGRSRHFTQASCESVVEQKN